MTRKLSPRKFESLRERLDKHLDEMESSVLKDLDTNANRNLSEGHQFLSEMEEKEQSIEQTRTTINMIKQLEKCPNGLAVINNNTGAVSCRDSKSFNIVIIDEEIVKQSIDVGGACHAVWGHRNAEHQSVRLMALSSGKICGSCDVQHITKAAIVWCTTCDEGLCSTCLGHHKTNKASRKHETIPINQYASLETFTSSIKQECEKHDQVISLYCLNHEVTACGLCIPEIHQQCTGLKPIDELARHAKNSADILDIERGFEEIGKTLEELRNNRQQNIDTIKDDKKTISTEIRTLKERLTKRLDEMESNILKAFRY
ncbi:unnamed protein product [Mytilus coruscus]|uniref:B box-type domain-containing protein n=1 Tax=Mytilus coruscus TaxID=42192 RepID=A0A6J8AA61_MYTCO|nr:unnamed protein product [Mytilus coruscus]